MIEDSWQRYHIRNLPETWEARNLFNSSLGTIMRSAQGLQWQSIWILKNGDIDLLDPLSIRASQNCLSTMPYSRGTIEETLEFANKNNLFMCKCTNNGIDVQSVEMQEKLKSYDGVMLLVGNIPYVCLHKNHTTFYRNYAPQVLKYV